MALTAKQIHDLDNMNVAAQRASLGTMLGSVSGNIIASGSITPTGPIEIIDTGLSAVNEVACSISGSPSIYHNTSTVSSGSVAGLIWLKSWKPTAAGDVTPVPADAAWSDVNWIAAGEL